MTTIENGTIVYETVDGEKRVSATRLQFNKETDHWRIETEMDGEVALVHVPRERVYHVVEPRESDPEPEREAEDRPRDEYGHPV